ncbi:MAG: GtrA family protein [Cypionkella sp.]
MEALRFLVVSGVGVVADIGIAWLLSAGLGLPIWLSATIGFAVAATLNYALHRGWTFRQASAMAEPARLLRYLMALGLTLAARLLAVLGFGMMLGANAQPLAVLVPSVAVSFAVSFVAAKLLVFRNDQARDAGLPKQCPWTGMCPAMN